MDQLGDGEYRTPTAHDLLVYPLILSNAEGVSVTDLLHQLIPKSLGPFSLRY